MEPANVESISEQLEDALAKRPGAAVRRDEIETWPSWNEELADEGNSFTWKGAFSNQLIAVGDLRATLGRYHVGVSRFTTPSPKTEPCCEVVLTQSSDRKRFSSAYI